MNWNTGQLHARHFQNDCMIVLLGWRWNKTELETNTLSWLWEKTGNSLGLKGENGIFRIEQRLRGILWRGVIHLFSVLNSECLVQEVQFFFLTRRIKFRLRCTFFQALLEILLVGIVVWHLPPKIAIMTGTAQPIAPCILKVPSGTTNATIPTWTACTLTARQVIKECLGTTGKTPTTLSKRSEMKIRPQNF